MLVDSRRGLLVSGGLLLGAAVVTLLHDTTLAGQALGPEMQDELRRLSVTSTHP